MRTQWILLGALVLSQGSCKTSDGAKPSATPLATETGASLPMCYGYRGNGSSVFATMGAIARLYDQVGEPSAVIGTSSGSVAAFLTESLMVPNSIYSCPNCSKTEVNERRSFMLKSFPLFVNALMKTEAMTKDLNSIQPALDVFNLITKLNPLFHDGKGEGEASEVAEKKPSVVRRAISLPFVQKTLSKAVLAVLRRESAEVKDMISPTYYRAAGFEGEGNDELMLKAINNILNFQGIVKDAGFERQRLMYPGLVNFDYVYNMMGTLADWYAGYGPTFPRQELEKLMTACATGSRGLWWNDIAARPYLGSNCGKEYFALFSKYYNERKKNPVGKRRVDEMMGIYMPSFVSSSAIGGNDVVAKISGWADAGQFAEIDKLDLGRENFRVLYFGAQEYRKVILANKNMFDDVITSNVVAMGSVPWRTGMMASSQEPATSRAVLYSEGDNNYLATGGFVDQLPTKMMKMLGCEKTVVINTNRPISDFANRYAPGIWNKDKDLVKDILDTENPKSAESIAFSHTSALLCARWDSYKVNEVWEMADNSYHNVLLTEDPALMVDKDLFRLKDGKESTRLAPPKECYSLPTERLERFEGYKL